MNAESDPVPASLEGDGVVYVARLLAVDRKNLKVRPVGEPLERRLRAENGGDLPESPLRVSEAERNLFRFAVVVLFPESRLHEKLHGRLDFLESHVVEKLLGFLRALVTVEVDQVALDHLQKLPVFPDDRSGSLAAQDRASPVPRGLLFSFSLFPQLRRAKGSRDLLPRADRVAVLGPSQVDGVFVHRPEKRKPLGIGNFPRPRVKVENLPEAHRLPLPHDAFPQGLHIDGRLFLFKLPSPPSHLELFLRVGKVGGNGHERAQHELFPFDRVPLSVFGEKAHGVAVEGEHDPQGRFPSFPVDDKLVYFRRIHRGGKFVQSRESLYSSAALMKSPKSGWAASGLDLNSG